MDFSKALPILRAGGTFSVDNDQLKGCKFSVWNSESSWPEWNGRIVVESTDGQPALWNPTQDLILWGHWNAMTLPAGFNADGDPAATNLPGDPVAGGS